ncbi:MAG: hypothetical protein LJE83_06950 [Gammaproteobacteria bacterium]|nr:hypothetical protein [Gammaproteobacteria bacterium]
MNYKPGEKSKNIPIESVDDYRNAAISLLKQAHRGIDIFTPDLEAEIYNHQEIEQSVFNLAKRHPTTRIRILVQDSTAAARDGHCLVRLAQQLSSYVFIHTPSDDYKNEHGAFVVVDNTGFIHRVSTSDRTYRATANFNAPQRAAELTGFFNEVWEHSSADIKTRRLYI